MYTTSSRGVRDLLIHSSYVHAEVGRVKDACFVRGGPDPVQSIGINRRPSPSHSIPTVSQPKGVLFVRSAFLTCLTYMPTWTIASPAVRPPVGQDSAIPSLRIYQSLLFVYASAWCRTSEEYQAGFCTLHRFFSDSSQRQRCIGFLRKM